MGSVVLIITVIDQIDNKHYITTYFCDWFSTHD